MGHGRVLLGVIAVITGMQTAQAREPGDLWEVTTEMRMEGMALPPNTQRVCSPKQSNEPPVGPGDDKCKVSDFKSSGTKTTWKVRCDGPPASTGSGEIVYQGKDRYSGTMQMSSSEGDMTIKYAGRRIGDCDASEMKRRVKQIEGQAAAQMAASCDQGAREGTVEMFIGANALCKDPKYRQPFCAGFSTQKTFDRMADDPQRLSAGAGFCGTTAEALRVRFCEDALQSENYDFLSRRCPVEAQTLAQRECAGRSYTSLTGSKYQSFCGRYASQAMRAGGRPAASAPPTQSPVNPADPTTEAVKEGVQKLRGLLGF